MINATTAVWLETWVKLFFQYKNFVLNVFHQISTLKCLSKHVCGLKQWKILLKVQISGLWEGITVYGNESTGLFWQAGPLQKSHVNCHFPHNFLVLMAKHNKNRMFNTCCAGQISSQTNFINSNKCVLLQNVKTL